jgi:hypothetical protein
MDVRQSARATPMWSLIHTYTRIVVCLLLLPLLVTGVVLVADARSDFVATVLIVSCCLYIDTDTLMRRSRARPKSAR